MYTREILAPRGSPVENGIPIAGTWNRAFSQVNLLDIHRPYHWPLPSWLRDCRIKEWEAFSVQDERFVLEAFLGNFKLCRIAQVILYNKESGENFVFRKFFPASGWRLPRSLAHGSVECRSSRFFFRVHTWLNAGTIKLDFDIPATRRQPAITAELSFNMEKRDVTPAVVSLKFDERRSMYAYKAIAAVRGDIVFGAEHFSLDPAQCSGIFRDYKGFFPYQMRGVFCGAMGFDGEGRRYGFHIAENQAKENRKNNENALWVNGQLTPLPPVRITMSNGPESNWVIQDVDGMVDLVFAPREPYRCGVSLLAISGDFFGSLGYYNGMVVSANGEQIQMKNQWGMGEKLYLRV
jgi:hypothetical protein